MVVIDGMKYACERCIRGHRVTTCTHVDLPLFQIKPKGRPASQCQHCRDSRKSRSLHANCSCGKKGNNSTCDCHSSGQCSCGPKRKQRSSSIRVSGAAPPKDQKESTPRVPRQRHDSSATALKALLEDNNGSGYSSPVSRSSTPMSVQSSVSISQNPPTDSSKWSPVSHQSSLNGSVQEDNKRNIRSRWAQQQDSTRARQQQKQVGMEVLSTFTPMTSPNAHNRPGEVTVNLDEYPFISASHIQSNIYDGIQLDFGHGLLDAFSDDSTTLESANSDFSNMTVATNPSTSSGLEGAFPLLPLIGNGFQDQNSYSSAKATSPGTNNPNTNDNVVLNNNNIVTPQPVQPQSAKNELFEFPDNLFNLPDFPTTSLDAQSLKSLDTSSLFSDFDVSGLQDFPEGNFNLDYPMNTNNGYISNNNNNSITPQSNSYLDFRNPTSFPIDTYMDSSHPAPPRNSHS